MTRSLGTNLLNHFGQECTSIATLWKITRTDGTVLGFTNHDKDINYDSVVYESSTGFTPSDVDLRSDFSISSQEIESVLDSSFISESDLLAGLYDYAEVIVMMINYESIADGVVIINKGWTGQIQVKDGLFISEIRGLSQKINQNIGELYSPSCRAILGDSRCGVSLASFTISDTVDSVTSSQVFYSSSLTQDPGYFTGGEVQWTSGNNNGLKMEIKDFLDGTVTLALAMPNSITSSDSFDIIAGCDKDSLTCKNKFSNLVNFRGEPNVPGQDAALETSSTRSS